MKQITYKIETPKECPHRVLRYIERNGPEYDREMCSCSKTGQECNEFYEFPEGCVAVKNDLIVTEIFETPKQCKFRSTVRCSGECEYIQGYANQLKLRDKYPKGISTSMFGVIDIRCDNNDIFPPYCMLDEVKE